MMLTAMIANAIAMPQKEIITATHLYDNIAIQSIDVVYSKKLHTNKLLISKSKFKSNPVRNDLFKVPEIGDPIWEITTKDLFVSEEVCLSIDALLCHDYKEIFKPDEAKCYNTCISNGPEFVAYDDKANLLYLTAGTNVVGTGGTPQFLFVADISKKQIKYLNTVFDPDGATLSPNGEHLAFNGWNEIDVYNTQTGTYIQIREENTHIAGREYYNSLENMQWLNNAELQYEAAEYDDKFQNKRYFSTEKIFNINTMQIVRARKIMPSTQH